MYLHTHIFHVYVCLVPLNPTEYSYVCLSSYSSLCYDDNKYPTPSFYLPLFLYFQLLVYSLPEPCLNIAIARYSTPHTE